MRPTLNILYFYLLEYCYKIQILLEQGTLLVLPGNCHHEHTYLWCLLHEHCHSEEAVTVQGTTCTAVCAGPVWESWASFPSHQETLIFYEWKGWVQWHGFIHYQGSEMGLNLFKAADCHVLRGANLCLVSFFRETLLFHAPRSLHKLFNLIVIVKDPDEITSTLDVFFPEGI